MTPAAAARVLAHGARRALAQRPAFSAALCGTAHAGVIARALARSAAWTSLDARRLHLFVFGGSWPPQAALPLASDHVHRPRTSLSRVEAALHYEQLLRAHFSLSAGELPVFDVVVLDGFGAADEDAVQLGRLVVPSGSGRALVLSAAVVRAAAQVLTVRPSEGFVPAREAG